MKHIFLDSNVLYDALFAREPFCHDAWQILSLASEGRIRVSVSTLTIVNAVYVARKYGVPEPEVRKSLLEMHRFVSFADLTEENIAGQLGCEWKDFEDAVQHECAIEDFADCMVTRNGKDYKLSSITVVTPQELLEQIS